MNVCFNVRGVSALLLVACLAVAGATAAQKPGTDAKAPAPAGVGTPPAGATATSSPRDDIRRELAEAQAQLDAIDAAGASGGAPPDTPASQSTDRRTLARLLVSMYQQQLETLARADAAQAQRTAAELADREWTGFPAPPPYSVLTIDTIRDSADAAAKRIAAAAARRVLLERFAKDIAPKLKASQAASRMAAEAADAARGTSQFARLEWERDLAALRARTDVATQELVEMGMRGAREETAAAQAVRDLAQRQLAAAGGDIVLAPADLARVIAEIEERRRAVERELERAARTAAAASEALTTAQRQLDQLRAAPAGKDNPAARTVREQDLAQEVAFRSEAAATATLRVNLLKDSMLVLAGERTAWAARNESLGAQDPLRARTAYENLAGSLAGVQARREYLDQELAATASRIGELETKLRAATGAETADVQQLLDTNRARESVLRDAVKSGQSLERVLARFRADLDGKREVSYTEKARDTAAGAWLQGRRLWNYEMFTVDDAYETADGRKLNVSRSVTIGKTIGAVLIVVVGYWLSRLIMGRVERILVSRGRLAPQPAALLRSWALFAVTAILVIFALSSASIPLTVFAFLGGALAIAAGFGLQTLLKNLVAGIILLIERPMRLGDLIDVDGVRGRVTQIGIRASTILTADGIESLIPNGTFLESKLTNWTYTSAETRQTITIGVPYGAALRRVAEILEGVLTKHGQVLKAPAPQVYLDEYADSSINFVLTYWVEMTLTNDTRRIRSDLLLMIDSAFSEAGLTLPFPQRDVHLDMRAPIKVEVVTPTPRA